MMQPRDLGWADAPSAFFVRLDVKDLASYPLRGVAPFAAFRAAGRDTTPTSLRQ